MKKRLYSGKAAVFRPGTDRPRTAERSRSRRPRLEPLESRRLLATVAEFRVPSGNGADPDGMTSVPGGSVWFTEFGADDIGTINPTTHAISEFPIPTPNAEPARIALGPDGNLWFTESATDKIGMINPVTDKITEYAIPIADAVPFGITAGPNNTVWFTEWSGNAIGSINTSTGKITEHGIPTLNSVPQGITVDQNGNVWFTESETGKIGMFDPTTNALVEHPLPDVEAEPDGITTGPGGNLYFTEYGGNQVGVYSLSSGTFSQFITVPTANTEPTEITAAPDGTLWFTQSKTNEVAMLNPVTQAITEVATPSAQSGPRGIVAASDGSIWFAELNSGNVATIVPSLHIAVTSPPPLELKVGETFGLKVAVDFDSGGVDTGYDGTVSLGLVGATAAGAGALVGTTSVTAVNGVASFNGLSLSDPGSFSIQVKSGSATPATIGPIDVAGPVGSSPINPHGPVPAPPVVLSEQLSVAGTGVNRYVSGIVLTFSSALEAASAQNASNYTVTQVTKKGRAKVVKTIRLRAIYNPANNTVKLALAGKQRFASGGQIILNAASPSGIAGMSGLYLEGNMGGYSGADGMYIVLPNGRGIAE